ncbi:LCP family glycopolymer transferase [Lactobacillus gasseri]|jgi:LCP family protein required for cell wall assembly|uniref:Cell envelope-like function transcriptional attenuator common domain protein n=2 Tax=Lactobacillus gasseri TaxID=1596 RepID=D1YKX3_LACGS|nr:LCP family protein [Lactobacillus gasseri]EFB61877.1 cell envelope-like function transcriptional attenuator common domain protein [Lactobacillus gasseri 224-1]MCZ3947850.1 LCP family protein [Lactobacillus gasseri]QTH65600.1 LCP family protein [Lactobacillus gasseri]RGL18643.1 LytR family transcriptional regulator [Lactobacillus gasseri]
MDNKPKEPVLSIVELNKEKHSKKKPIRIIIAVVLVLVLGLGAYAGSVYFKAKNAFDKTYDPKNAVKQDSFSGKEPFNILLLGTDTGAFGRKEVRGNSDTMIIVTVNPAKKKLSLMSIPRDTMARMIGTESFSVHKINAAYNIGGAKMAMQTTSKVLNVPIKYYISMNMGGMRKIVDGVGGVTVTPPLTFTYDGYTFTKGKKVHLNGSQALAYSRMRYDDPKGDYGRQLRQREVIMSVLEHAMSFSTLKNLDSILGSVSTSLRTNLTFDSMVKISKNYRKCIQNMSSDYLHGVGAMIGDASYQVMSDKELQRTSNIVRNDLGLDSMNIDNNETYQNSMNSQFDWTSGDSNQVYYVYDPYTDELWNGDRAY